MPGGRDDWGLTSEGVYHECVDSLEVPGATLIILPAVLVDCALISSAAWDIGEHYVLRALESENKGLQQSLWLKQTGSLIHSLLCSVFHRPCCFPVCVSQSTSPVKCSAKDYFEVKLRFTIFTARWITLRTLATEMPLSLCLTQRFSSLFFHRFLKKFRHA